MRSSPWTLLRSDTIVLCALLTALALTASLFEGALPSPLPGIRLGIANIFSLTALILIGKKAAVTVTLLRTVLVLLLSGNIPAFCISLPSGIAAILTAILLYRCKKLFTLPWISVASATVFNIVQITAVCLLIGSAGAARLLPPLLCIGALCGWGVGYLAEKLGKQLSAAKTLFHSGHNSLSPRSSRKQDTLHK